MVLRVWLLSLPLLFVALCAMAAPAGKNYCLECHDGHYAELDSCVGCHRGFQDTPRIDIAHSGLIAARFAAFTIAGSPVARRGEQRFKESACRRCHVSGGTGNGLAANLDLAQQDMTPEELVSAIRFPVMFMPDFRFSDTQRVELVNAILAAAKKAEIPAGEIPAVVHFEGEDASGKIQFEKHCGGCHRVLTAQLGGLGHGIVGPNLSGVFSEYYPQNFGEEAVRWNVENLKKWIANPRKVRPFSRMPPLQLEAAEFERLCRELRHDDISAGGASE